MTLFNNLYISIFLIAQTKFNLLTVFISKTLTVSPHILPCLPSNIFLPKLLLASVRRILHIILFSCYYLEKNYLTLLSI